METNDPTVNIIEWYKTRPSIRLIKELATRLDNRFFFEKITFEDIHNEIRKLDSMKTSHDTDIPLNIIKKNVDIFGNFLYFNYDKAVSNCEFPTSFKNTNTSSVYKKNSRLEEKNYCSISILLNLSKIYKRIMHSQISTYFDNVLSKYHFGFRQGYRSQQCLLVLIEKHKKYLDKGGKCWALLTNLSKAFDCPLHDLLIAKLYACGFENNLLRLIYCYFVGWKQQVKIDNECSI